MITILNSLKTFLMRLSKRCPQYSAPVTQALSKSSLSNLFYNLHSGHRVVHGVWCTCLDQSLIQDLHQQHQGSVCLEESDLNHDTWVESKLHLTLFEPFHVHVYFRISKSVLIRRKL